MLPRISRITREQTFSLIIKKGFSLSFSLMRIKWIFSENPYPRFGIVVSNKISKKATVRNKIKRRIRELLREFIKKQPHMQIDGIIFVKPHIVNASFQDIAHEVQYALDNMRKKISPNTNNTYKYKENQ